MGCEYVHISLVLIGFSEMRGNPWDPGVNQGRPWAVRSGPRQRPGR